MPKNKRFVLIRKWRKEVSRSIKATYFSKFPDFDPHMLSDLTEIEKEFRCRIFLWGRRSQFAKYECFRKSPYMAPTDYDHFVDLILSDSEIELSLENVGLVFNFDETIPPKIRMKRKTWTLFEAIAIAKQPTLEENISELRAVVKKLETEWGKPAFHFADARDFFRKFKTNPQIWSVNTVNENQICREKIWDRRGSPKVIGMFSY